MGVRFPLPIPFFSDSATLVRPACWLTGAIRSPIFAPLQRQPHMTSTLTVPASIEDIIQRFDANEEPFDEHKIAGELRTASAVLVEPTEAARAGAWAEYLAFALT